MAAAYLGDTDSEDELPVGWEERIHTDGRLYFANHSTQSTQWTHPKTGGRKSVPKELPYGWKKDVDDDGVVVFLEEESGKKTYSDPRLAFARDTKKSLYDFKQRFDASSTALQILNGLDLSSKKALITGANSGIGFETAKSLARHGCEIIFACRDEVKARAAIELIKADKPTANVEFVHLDLQSLQSVKMFANEIKMKHRSLDYLICNAGVFAAPFALTEDNYERTFQVNHLAQFYLILLMKPLLIETSSSRIIILSSESHRFSLLTKENMTEQYLSPSTAKDFTAFMAYNDSKLCNTIISSEINRRWAIHGITCNSVHPGNMVSTGLSRYWWFYRILFSLVRPFTKSLQQASATTIWGATADELVGVGGQYLNNCWLCVPSSKTQDKDFSEQLWNISVEMIEAVVGPIVQTLDKTVKGVN